VEKFRKIIAPFVEGLIVGIFLIVVLNILGIETTQAQFTIIVVTVILGTSIASAVGRLIAKGEVPLRCEWVYKYGESRIEVTAGLTEKLYINDELVDTAKGVSFKQASLKGKLNTGEEVIATIIGGTSVKCQLLVGSEELQAIATKGDLIG